MKFQYWMDGWSPHAIVWPCASVVSIVGVETLVATFYRIVKIISMSVLITPIPRECFSDALDRLPVEWCQKGLVELKGNYIYTCIIYIYIIMYNN